MNRRISLSVTTYQSAECAAFMRSREKYGHLSNMTPYYPLRVNGLRFQGPEGLYQAFKYPEEPAFQERIAEANSGMAANKLTYRNPNVRPDWDEVRVYAMIYTVAVKLAQHPIWIAAVEKTKQLPIVEISSRNDLWGARPDRATKTLTGRNVLGKILTALRAELRLRGGDTQEAAASFAANLPLERLSFNESAAPSTDPGAV